jgi:hypothetical protein
LQFSYPFQRKGGESLTCSQVLSKWQQLDDLLESLIDFKYNLEESHPMFKLISSKIKLALDNADKHKSLLSSEHRQIIRNLLNEFDQPDWRAPSTMIMPKMDSVTLKFYSGLSEEDKQKFINLRRFHFYNDYAKHVMFQRTNMPNEDIAKNQVFNDIQKFEALIASRVAKYAMLNKNDDHLRWRAKAITELQSELNKCREVEVARKVKEEAMNRLQDSRKVKKQAANQEKQDKQQPARKVKSDHSVSPNWKF